MAARIPIVDKEYQVESWSGTVTPEPGQSYTLRPQTADYQGNAGIAELQAGSGVVRRASLAYLEYDVTDETQFTLQATANGSGRTLQLLLDNQPLQRYALGGGAVSYPAIALPGSGERRLKIVLGRGDRDNEQGDIIAPAVVSLTFPGAGTAVVVKATPAEEVIEFVDSIGSGAIASDETKAYAYLLRTANRGYTASGYGSHTAFNAFGTAAARTKGLAQCNTLWSRSGVIKTGGISLLTNDYAFMTGNPTQRATEIAMFLDLVIAQHPTSRWWIFTPTPRYDKTGALGGYTLQNFRDELAKVAVGREHFVNIVDGPTMLPARADLGPDDLHPRDSGHTKIAVYKAAQFNARAFAASPSGPVIMPPPAVVRQPLPSGMAAEWQPARGRKTTLVGNTLTHQAGATDGWNSYAPSRARVKSPPMDFAGVYLRVRFPNLTRATAAVVLMLAPQSIAASHTDEGLSTYMDNELLALTINNSNPVVGSLYYSDPVGPLDMVCYVNMATGEGWIRLCRPDDATNTTIAGEIGYASAFPAFIHGFCYGNPGWSPGQQASTLDGVTLISDFLEEAFI